MYNNNNINVTPKLIRGAIWGVAGFFLFIVAMAFIRPWYNVWSQEMEGKAEFAKRRLKPILKPRNSTRRQKSNVPKVLLRLSVSRTEALPPHTSSISGCVSSLTSTTRP